MSNPFLFSNIPAPSKQILVYETEQEITFVSLPASAMHETSLQQQNYFRDFLAFGLQENTHMAVNERLLQQHARVQHISAFGNHCAYRNPSMHRAAPPSFGSFVRSLAVRPASRIHKPQHSMAQHHRCGNREHQPSFFMTPLPNYFVVNQMPVHALTNPQPTRETMGFGNHQSNNNTSSSFQSNNTSSLPGGSGHGTQKHEPKELDLTLKLGW